MTLTPRVYIIHENPDWLPPFTAAFLAEGVDAEEILLTKGSIDLDTEPAPGVYWSRMSASAHTRGNTHSKDFTRAYLCWLEQSGQRIVNGGDTINFEVSKVQQHRALRTAGFDVPTTVAVFGRDGLRERSREFALPFITKHNQGGKGLGVRRFDSYDAFDAYLASPEFEEPVDGITLLQEYLVAERPFITRVEFVGGRYVYAVRVDISAGSFELCPADACLVAPGDTPGDAPGDTPGDAPAAPFSLREGFDGDPLIARYEAFLAEQGIEIAGVEFIETADGRRVTYDVNTNTNYNPDVEAAAELPAARAIARFLGSLLPARVPA
ncbi:MAG: alpha-L-glutamate ligase [Cryobacterium sp.]|uniref:ATP-grasp domain-containing protein n=1 Tax=Cryobacterium sp. TaxID=1926290 RepID=UPI00228A9313|nr:alpha-L-glutamate ligase [Cryobacterium sp.]MCY7403661.1 alpha-L-glutamate ligase [Cryobacterium sp.]